MKVQAFYCKSCHQKFYVTEDEYKTAKREWDAKQPIDFEPRILVIPPFSIKGHYPWIWREDQNYDGED